MSPDPDIIQEQIKHERELREAWQKAHLTLHKSEAEALATARNEIDRRLSGMNEIREQINNERGRYLLREFYDEQHASLRDTMDVRLKALETKQSNMEGRMWMLGTAISAIVILVNLVLYYLGKH